MDEALSEALALYRETRSELFQHQNDVEALLKVVNAADNLAKAVEEVEPIDPVLERFMTSLTEYLEDGNDANSVKKFIGTNYMPKPQGTARNRIIILVNEHLPDLSQRRLAKVCGTDQSTVSRVLTGEDTGGGDRGHGGARPGSGPN